MATCWVVHTHNVHKAAPPPLPSHSLTPGWFGGMHAAQSHCSQVGLPPTGLVNTNITLHNYAGNPTSIPKLPPSAVYM